MKRFRRNLTYGNVMSTLFVFLLLAGGTAVAANQLAKKSVGAKQLKNNAVTTAKIKKEAVTKAKIKDAAIDGIKLADNAVTTSKIPDGAVTGAKIAPGSTGFVQRLARLQKSELVPFASGAPYPIGTYTQKAGEVNQYVAAVDFQFDASCKAPRSASALLLMDALNPAAPMPWDFAGVVNVTDESEGTVRKRSQVVPFPAFGAALNRTAPTADIPHKFDLFLAGGSCSAATTGANLAGVTIDVIGGK